MTWIILYICAKTLKMNKADLYPQWKRRFGDRYDGWRLRHVDPFFLILPFILKNRLDSQNLFAADVDLDAVEEFIKKHKQDMPDLSIMHVIVAALVRVISQRPRINRFIVWNKLFARNHIAISLVVKRNLTDEGEETLTKTHFMPEDSLVDVTRKLQKEIDENAANGTQNATDITSKLLGALPPFILRLAIQFFYCLDNIGCLPRFIHHVSPWHCSIFVTNLGSIGIDPIYHHLSRFGTCSMFVAMGKKKHDYELNRDGQIVRRKHLSVKVTMDERICDGFYYASSMRLFNKILANPEVLLGPPDAVIADDGI